MVRLNCSPGLLAMLLQVVSVVCQTLVSRTTAERWLVGVVP
jgi:hypothetical protein